MDRPRIDGDWTHWGADAIEDRLASSALPGFLNRQRWFGGKARRIDAARIAESTQPGDLPIPVVLTLVDVHYHNGRLETYFLPLALAEAGDRDAILAKGDASPLAEIRHQDQPALLYDALRDPDFGHWLLQFIASRGSLHGRAGRFVAEPIAPPATFLDTTGHPLPAQPMGVEQSNSSIRYADQLILKLFRRVEEGENPELEIGRFLTEKTRFANVPRTVGVLEYHRDGQAARSLGIVQNQIQFQQVGWEQTLAEAATHLQATIAGRPEAAESAVTLSESAASILGRRTAELHQALASDPTDPDFLPQPLTADHLAQLLEETRAQATRALDQLTAALDSLPTSAHQVASNLLDARAEFLDRLNPNVPLHAGGFRIRCHGDYHLGQVLWTGTDYMILDFEGEPAKSLAERRARHSPAKDVVGMLRSYDYAGYASLFQASQSDPGLFSTLRPVARTWTSRLSDAFLQTYLQILESSGLLPESSSARRRLFDIYLIDKACYELEYELNNRPDWVSIPLHALFDILDHPSHPA